MSDQQYPEPTARAFIFNAKGELLLLQSHKWPDRYVVPGGHVELGERLEQAVIRESKEETGLDVYDVAFINFQEFIYDPAFWKPRHFIFFDFSCKTDGAEVRLNDEAQGYIWVEPHKALSMPLDGFTRRSVEVYLKKTSPV